MKTCNRSVKSFSASFWTSIDGFHFVPACHGSYFSDGRMSNDFTLEKLPSH